MSTVGRYRIRRRLGAGGMAEVLEAEALGDSGFVRRVAVKRMLGTAREDASFARMFLDEARIASRLHHANIVSVLDYGVVDGTPFQVLELVDGVDARTLIRRSVDGCVPEDIALYIVAQIGHALASAHGARDERGEEIGIVHRDVSPGNILVSWDGDVKLADFGIAFAKDKSEKTEVGMTKGTLLYMSPEQATTGRVDARSDVFSLGCVLHTLVTGASPLAKGAAQTFYMERTLKLADGLSEDVQSIIEMATRYEPSQRFQSAVAMTEAVGRALATRIDREPRRRLMQYLSPMREKVVESPGRLDAFLCVDIVADGAATERHFHTAAFEPTHTSLGASGDAVVSPTEIQAGPTAIQRRATLPFPSPAPNAGPRPSRGLPVALVLGGLLVTGGALAWVARPFLWTHREVSAPADAGATVASPPETTVVLPSEPARSAEPSVSASPSASSASPSPSPLASARFRPHPPAAHSVTPAQSGAPVVATSCSGTLYLSCPAAPRAAISIDGAVSRYHHGDFAELPCAKHAIVFEGANGRRDQQGATPSSANTRTSPLEVRCRLD